MSTQADNNYPNRENEEAEKEMNQEHQQGFKLPDPDMDNVTVLTENLPNNPILPWRNYDSPWQDDDNQQEDNHNQED